MGEWNQLRHGLCRNRDSRRDGDSDLLHHDLAPLAPVCLQTALNFFRGRCLQEGFYRVHDHFPSFLKSLSKTGNVQIRAERLKKLPLGPNLYGDFDHMSAFSHFECLLSLWASLLQERQYLD